MKKFILPLAFLLSFSGRPIQASDKPTKCEGVLLFYNSTSIAVTKIEITDLTWGGTTTYNNPSFPLWASVLNSNLSITEYFSAAHSGNVQIPTTGFCTRFDNVSSVSFELQASCTYYPVQLVNDGAPVDCN